MKQIISILFIASALISCKKSPTNDEYTITGLVLDWDSRTPIPGAKVYAKPLSLWSIAKDSSLSDASGRVSFRFKKEEGNLLLTASKPGLLLPFYSVLHNPAILSRTDTLFLARPTNLNLTTFRSTNYQAADSIRIKITSYPPFFLFGTSLSNLYEFIRPANAADTAMNLSFIYYPPPNQKAYILLDILRNGSIISSRSDSTALIQNSTQNYTLNY